MRASAATGPLASIAGFAAMLRDHGMKVGIAEQQAMVRAAQAVPVDRAARLDAAWRSIACHDARDWRRWPELFDRYWHPERLQGSVKVSGQTRPARDLRQIVQAMHESMAGAAPPRPAPPGRADTALDAPAVADDAPELPRAQGGASRAEALHDRSLAQWLPQELATLERLAERIAQRLRRQLTRRWRDDAHGRRLDVRRTLRASLRTGGVPVTPAWRTVRRERPRLFLLVDVSRSMETHAQLFLRCRASRIERGHQTPLLRRDSVAVQEKVNAVTAGFGGGTRIATSVADFTRVHARAQLGRRARVWILSDGFDADEPPRLGEELAQLRGRGARIAWLHPGPTPPPSQAVQGARACIERFVRLASLRDLEHAASVLQ